MAPIITESSHLVNALAISSQLETSSSRLDGVSRELEDSVRYETSRLIQAAGVLLRLPQEIIAQAIITLQRFWAGPDGGSMLDHDSGDVGTTALYLTAKPSGHAASPRQVLTAFAFLESTNGDFAKASLGEIDHASSWRLPEGDYEVRRDRLYKVEAHILRVLGFQTRVALPYSLCINYLQTLEAFQEQKGPDLAKRAFAHLNTALLSPQLLYLTHQPCALATASIYLAAREVRVNLPDVEWWEVFDVDREELGFLVVALRSMSGFVGEESRRWVTRKVPTTVEELRAEMERQRMLETGE